MPVKTSGNFEDATRAQVVALRSIGATAKQVEEITGMAERTQRSIVQKAKERGYNGGKLLNLHVKDGERSGRPKKTPPTPPNDEATQDVSNLSQSIFEQLIEAQQSNSSFTNNEAPLND